MNDNPSGHTTVAKTVEQLKRYFSNHPQVMLAYLFGSHARGTAHRHSDVDIAVLLRSQNDNFEVRLQIMSDLGQLLQRNDVDVAILNQTPLALTYRVVRDGQLLFCADEDQRIHFVSQAIVRYLDFEPIIIQHEQAILKRAREGALSHGYDPHCGALDRYYQRRQRLKETTGVEL